MCWVMRCSAVFLVSGFCRLLVFAAEFLGAILWVQTTLAVFSCAAAVLH
ncbi:hypothetical protein MtrunA17_Chr7g0250521 [Medicago truncatula]|uniref:Uncharacterized protein n=1 Tax=Medicago truncatula TaxID=3880 RepID=A0A396H8B2_MEDTR|nr:hypothetical protein MtrunA17_Chr7g0250521 [Medicago truncatula]